MRWQSGRRSDNVVDRRGISLGRGAIGGGAVIAAVVATLLGAPQSVVRSLLEGGGGVTETQSGRAPTAAENEAADFVKVVLGSTEDVWAEVLPSARRRYEPPKLVLFTEAVQSACGINGAAVGPFYCPLDSRVYLDLTFFGELDRRFGAPGDFAQAYVVAHEVGHHVQNLLGISERVHAQRTRLPPARGPTGCPSRPSCRPTAWRASGRSTPTATASCSSPATPRRACGGRRHRRRHAAESRRAAGSSPSRSRTARPRSACAGSDAGWRPAGSPTATPSGRRALTPGLTPLR